MEIWREVVGYEDFYKISNLGRIKSIERLVKNKNGYRSVSEKILKQSLGTSGYNIIMLKGKPMSIHKIVATTFLNHKPCGFLEVVDHIDNNKLNNKVDNLQLLSNRQNSIKTVRGKSKYPGIYMHKASNKWISRILIGEKRYYLGSFNNEEDAALAYKIKLNSIN